MKKIISCGALFLMSLTTFAQQKSIYNAYELFHPLWNYQSNSPYRSGSGIPGAAYWQNAADYKINVSLDETKSKVSGDVEITYKNNLLRKSNIKIANYKKKIKELEFKLFKNTNL